MIDQNNIDSSEMRLDKWLWCARFYKTRALAAAAIKKGRIQINDQTGKPSSAIHPGDIVTIKSGPYLQRLTVLALAYNRVSAQATARLYSEDQVSIERRRLLAEQLRAHRSLYPASQVRPGKRDRRKLTAFKKGLA